MHRRVSHRAACGERLDRHHPRCRQRRRRSGCHQRRARKFAAGPTPTYFSATSRRASSASSTGPMYDSGAAVAASRAARTRCARTRRSRRPFDGEGCARCCLKRDARAASISPRARPSMTASLIARDVRWAPAGPFDLLRARNLRSDDTSSRFDPTSRSLTGRSTRDQPLDRGEGTVHVEDDPVLWRYSSANHHRESSRNRKRVRSR